MELERSPRIAAEPSSRGELSMAKSYTQLQQGRLARRTVLGGGLALLALPLLARPSLAAAKVLRISTPGAADEWQSKALEVFKQALDKAAPGAFDVQIHYNGTLFAQGTEIEAMQRGNLEVAMISPQDIAALIPDYSIFTSGYLMRDAGHLDAVYDGDIGKEYRDRVEKELGIHIVRSQYLGTRHVILRQPRDVKAPADLAGLKLRMPGSEAWQFLGNSLGANATPLSFEEIYLALQTGTIDGLENPLPDVISNKFYEVAKEVVLTSHMVANTFFAISKPFWDGLSDSERKAIETAEDEAKKFNDEGVKKTEAEAVAFLQGKGVKVVTPDVAAFRKQVQEKFATSDFAKTWPAGMLDRINKAGT
jgi:tripartite ATP-independent transporter DctP family solute receptor